MTILINIFSHSCYLFIDLSFIIYYNRTSNRLCTSNKLNHGLLIENGRICHIVKLPISMIRPFSLVSNSHITLYPQLEIIWKVSKSLRKYWGKFGQISFYIISCITRIYIYIYMYSAIVL